MSQRRRQRHRWERHFRQRASSARRKLHASVVFSQVERFGFSLRGGRLNLGHTTPEPLAPPPTETRRGHPATGRPLL
jgi:hypothetical protein